MSSHTQRDTDIQGQTQTIRRRGRPRKLHVVKAKTKSKTCLIPFLLMELKNKTGGIAWVDEAKNIFKLDWTHLTNGHYDKKSIEI